MEHIFTATIKSVLEKHLEFDLVNDPVKNIVTNYCTGLKKSLSLYR